MNQKTEEIVEEVVKCRRCGRKLKDPKFIALGFGDSCYKKFLAEQKRVKRLF